MERTVLKEERDYYDENFERFEKEYPGQHLVICGRKVVGAYSSRHEAIGVVYDLGFKDGALVRKSGTRGDTLVAPVLVTG